MVLSVFFLIMSVAVQVSDVSFYFAVVGFIIQNVTKGARHKIALSIQKLRERQSVLKSLEKVSLVK